MIVTGNYKNIVEVESQRREKPSVIQQMQEDLATLNNRLPSQEDLAMFEQGVKNAEIGITLQKEEVKLLSIRSEIKEHEEEIKRVAEELKEIESKL